MPKDCRGLAALEYAVMATAFITLLLGIAYSAVAFHQYLEVSNAAGLAARSLAASRGSSTPWSNCCDNTVSTSAVVGATANLTASSLTVTASVNGSTCNTNTGCQALLTPASAGNASYVQVSYPCNMNFAGINFIPNCKVSTKITEMIQ
jgi:Flp pilus assembly protein TadG